MLKIQFKDKRQDAIWIVEKDYSIGRGLGSNLHIDDDSIDDTHARLITDNEKLFLKDNHSSAGSYVNEQRVTQKEVLPGDLIRLGNVEIEVFDPREPLSQSARTDKISNTRWKLVADSSWLSGQEYPLPGERVSVGRANDCDITIPGTHLSRQHAELHVQGNVLHVHDLASANGTFINEKRITDGIARPGDRLRLDVYSFRVIGPPSENDRTQVRRARPQKHSSAEKIAQNVDSKSWKTKPTSPGNRIKPDYSAGSKLITMISISLLIGMAAVLSYMFIS